MGRPPQVGSVSSTSAWESPVVASVTVREYQPVRVLTSVLLSPQAPTRMSASIGPGSGLGQSSRHSYFSRPPWPVSTIAFIARFIRHPSWIDPLPAARRGLIPVVGAGPLRHRCGGATVGPVGRAYRDSSRWAQSSGTRFHSRSRCAAAWASA